LNKRFLIFIPILCSRAFTCLTLGRGGDPLFIGLIFQTFLNMSFNYSKQLSIFDPRILRLLGGQAELKFELRPLATGPQKIRKNRKKTKIIIEMPPAKVFIANRLNNIKRKAKNIPDNPHSPSPAPSDDFFAAEVDEISEEECKECSSILEGSIRSQPSVAGSMELLDLEEEQQEDSNTFAKRMSVWFRKWEKNQKAKDAAWTQPKTYGHCATRTVQLHKEKAKKRKDSHITQFFSQKKPRPALQPIFINLETLAQVQSPQAQDPVQTSPTPPSIDDNDFELDIDGIELEHEVEEVREVEGETDDASVVTQQNTSPTCPTAPSVTEDTQGTGSAVPTPSNFVLTQQTPADPTPILNPHDPEGEHQQVVLPWG
jgi:hypothetical protein